MKRYPAWQVLYRSFYSMDFYRDVAENWGEFGFLHLFLLAGLNWAALAIALQLSLGTFLDTMLLPLTDQFPTITSADGKFSIDKPSPYKVKDKNGNTIIIFDMSGHPEDPHGAVLLTEQGLMSPPQSELRADKWPMEGSLTPKLLHDIITWIRNYAALLVFFVGWFFGTVFLFIQALLYSIVGLIFNTVMKANLSYGKLLRLAAVAITPPMVVDTILKAFLPMALTGSEAVVWSVRLGSIVAALVYLGLAVNACKTLTDTAVPDMTPSPTPEPPADITVDTPPGSAN